MAKRALLVSAFLLVGLVGLSSSAAAQGVGIKGGVVFPEFNSDALDLDNRTGWQAGLFFGGNRDGVVGVQGEVNYLRKTASLGGIDLTVDYLQIPVLLRLQSPSQSASGFQVYGLIGPSFDVKVREEIAGVVLDDITDGFEGLDVGAMVGVGVEAGRFLLEGRYSRGLRQVNKNFSDASEIKTHSFAVLAGFRFN